MSEAIRTIIAAGAVVLTAAVGAQAEEPYSIAWTRQLGTPSHDYGWGAAAHLGNVFISGSTQGALAGPSAGLDDAFVTKYDPAGNLLWTRQLGTSRWDASYGVAADPTGNVFISGRSDGSLGGPNAGGNDAFVSKYDPSGSLLWTRQLGTSEDDSSRGVAADPLGNVFISGRTRGSLGGPNAGYYDAFVGKYDPSGALLWTRQLGTPAYDSSRAVAADPLGNVFISGNTVGSLGGPNAGKDDAFVSKYDPSGSLLWTRQLGTSSGDFSVAVAADHLGNVLISGYTWGSLAGPNAGSYDAFVSKYDPAGSLLWTRQLGTSSGDFSVAVAADHLGNVFISGYTWGSLGGPCAGEDDAFVSKYDPAGNLLWTRQLGTSANDLAGGVAADGLGNVFISGYTVGSLGGPNAGECDAFLAKLAVPEPACAVLLVAGCLLLLGGRRRGA